MIEIIPYIIVIGVIILLVKYLINRRNILKRKTQINLLCQQEIENRQVGPNQKRYKCRIVDCNNTVIAHKNTKGFVPYCVFHEHYSQF